MTAKLIPASTWADNRLDPPPSAQILRRWCRQGRIPGAVIARNRADLSIALGLLAQEKQKNELPPGRAKAEGYY